MKQFGLIKNVISSAIIIGAIRLNNAYFGEGSSPVLLTYVYCSTPKNSLMNCSIQHTTWRINYRDRNSVIGVRCQSML